MMYRAAAKRGKSVLHLDPAGYYGSHWTSFQLDQFLDWSESHRCDNGEASGDNSRTHANSVTSSASHEAQREPQAVQDSPEFTEDVASAGGTSALNAGHPADGIGSQQIPELNSTAEEQSFLEVSISSDPGRYTNVEVQTAQGAELGPAREYNIDLAPRVRPYLNICDTPLYPQGYCKQWTSAEHLPCDAMKENHHNMHIRNDALGCRWCTVLAHSSMHCSMLALRTTWNSSCSSRGTPSVLFLLCYIPWDIQPAAHSHYPLATGRFEAMRQ